MGKRNFKRIDVCVSVCVCINIYRESFPISSVVKNLPANAGDIINMDSIPKSGIFPGEGNGNPL